MNFNMTKGKEKFHHDRDLLPLEVIKLCSALVLCN
jgi:hypothetical protein